MICPICGSDKMWIYEGLWHCNHCPYWGNPNERISASNNTKEHKQ